MPYSREFNITKTDTEKVILNLIQNPHILIKRYEVPSQTQVNYLLNLSRTFIFLRFSDMNYFAYGSNMSVGRLSSRIADIRVMGTYVLNRHDLRFHKISDTDGSAKCDVFYTGQTSDTVYGVLYRIDEKAKQILDKIEGLGIGYEVKKVQLISVDDQSEKEAFTYYATDIDPSLRPYEWYVTHVLKGAHEAGFPKGYLNKLERVKTLRDSDRKREEKELSIYEHVSG